MVERAGVRWIDAKTGEDFTDRMADPSARPGKGILELARALGRLAAAEQAEAERRLLTALVAELNAPPDGAERATVPLPGDELTLDGATYRYDGSTDDGEHFTRQSGPKWPEALVSLRRGSQAADWMLRHLVRA